MKSRRYTARLRLTPAALAAAVIIAVFSFTAGTQLSERQSSVLSAAQPIQSDSSGTDRIQCFFPRDGQKAQSALIRVIQSADTNLDVAIYSFTDKSVADAILKAKDKGVSIRLISDRQQSGGKYQKSVLDKLVQAGIPVKVDSHTGIMHLKATIADSKVATTGSYNYTKSANEKNDEVFVILNDQQIASGFEQEFSRMWNNKDDFKDYPIIAKKIP